MLAISILFPWVAHTNESIAEQQKEQKQAIDGIFSQMGVTSEAQRWGDIYTQLIQSTLPDQSQYTGEICRVNIRLDLSGVVRRVTILPPPTNSKTPRNDLLCNEVFLAVYRVKQFPMSDQPKVKEKLQNINLTVSAN